VGQPPGVDGVAISLATGRTVSGRVEFQPGTTPVPAQAVLQRASVENDNDAFTRFLPSGSRARCKPLERDGLARRRGPVAKRNSDRCERQRTRGTHLLMASIYCWACPFTTSAIGISLPEANLVVPVKIQ